MLKAPVMEIKKHVTKKLMRYVNLQKAMDDLSFNTSYVILSISSRISLCSSTIFGTSYNLEKSIIVPCCREKQNKHMSYIGNVHIISKNKSMPFQIMK
jgi:hypothetical protein